MRKYPAGFRPLRGLNWGALGLMYASYYMCRYNFRFAGPGMNQEFGFDTAALAKPRSSIANLPQIRLNYLVGDKARTGHRVPHKPRLRAQASQIRNLITGFVTGDIFPRFHVWQLPYAAQRCKAYP